MKKLLTICFALLGFVAMGQSLQDTVQIDLVVVTGSRCETAEKNLPMTVTVFERETLAENQRTNVLPTLTEQVPGLFVSQRGMMGFGVSNGSAGEINLRGVSSGNGQLLVLIDGHPQYQGVYGHSISDSYQTMMVEKVEVLRGPASVLYGSNAMGGVINIVTRDMTRDSVSSSVNLSVGSWGTFQAEATNQVRKGRFSSTVSAQYGRSDNHQPRMEFEQYGGFAKFGYDVDEHWKGFADVNLTHFNASNPGSTSSPLFEADQWITRGVANLGVEHEFAKVSGRISVYDNFGNHKINDGYGPAYNNNKPQTELFRSYDAVEGVSWFETIKLSPKNRITIGADYQHIYGHVFYVNRKTGEVVTAGRRGMQSTNSQNDEIAGYVDVRQMVTKWLTVDAGLRYDYHNVAGGEWVPQTGIVLHPMPKSDVKLMAGKGFRNPSIKELYMYGTANHDSLAAERMWNYEISWRQRFKTIPLAFGVNVYYIKGDNMIQTVAGKNINTGEIRNKGVEFDAVSHINQHWSLSTNHSFLRMENPVAGAPEYKGFVGCSMHYGKWNGAIGLQQLCGLYNEVGETEKQTDATLLNASVSFQILKKVRLWLKGENLLGQQYEIIAGYPMPRATCMGGINMSF